MTRKPWRIRLGGEAERDFVAIVRWTHDTFGAGQANIYRATLMAALKGLKDGPDLVDAQRREDVGPGIRTLHIARRGRRGRHLLMYRVAEPDLIDVLRILHDAMDLARHTPAGMFKLDP